MASPSVVARRLQSPEIIEHHALEERTSRDGKVLPDEGRSVKRSPRRIALDYGLSEIFVPSVVLGEILEGEVAFEFFDPVRGGAEPRVRGQSHLLEAGGAVFFPEENIDHVAVGKLHRHDRWSRIETK